MNNHHFIQRNLTFLLVGGGIVFFCGDLVSPTQDRCGSNSETAEHHDLNYLYFKGNSMHRRVERQSISLSLFIIVDRRVVPSVSKNFRV